MLDAGEYAKFFPGEIVDTTPTAQPTEPPMSPALMAALAQLEKEFEEILKAKVARDAESREETSNVQESGWREPLGEGSDWTGLVISLGVVATWLFWVAFLAYQLVDA